MPGGLRTVLIPDTHLLVRKFRINPADQASDDTLIPQATSQSGLEVFVASTYIKFSMRHYLCGEACQ